ncbi:copper amine oxidase N-terminal domain-containing protein, partial [Paenibacillus sepulcri]|nr:copper amine oxidase N-terminal domain-containing protein [Paenibacillus sepulcri]
LAAFAVFAVLGAALLSALTVLIDPLQFYHQAIGYTPVLYHEERYQNPGLAKNYTYDTIIIGTSMTENFLPSEVGRELKGKALKLSLEGSTADEHHKMASLALQTGQVQKVLWGLDYFSLKQNTEESASLFPGYMYDNHLWNDYPYWFSYSAYQQFITSMKANLKGTASDDLEYQNNWGRRAEFDRQLVVQAYKDAQSEEVYFGLGEDSVEEIKQSFNTHVLSLVADNPDVDFYFFYPPYSVLRQVAWLNLNPGRFQNQLLMRKWIFEQFSKLPNVKLYDFQSERQWTYDLDQYKDLSHHSPQINSLIAQSIGSNDARYLVTADNVEKLNRQLEADSNEAVLLGNGLVRNIEVKIGGKQAAFSQRSWSGGETGDMLIPAKEAAAALGAAIAWDQTTKSMVLSRQKHRLKAAVGSVKATADGADATLTAAPQIINGTAMVPIRSIARHLGWTDQINQPSSWTIAIELDEKK